MSPLAAVTVIGIIFSPTLMLFFPSPVIVAVLSYGIASNVMNWLYIPTVIV